MLEWCAGKGKAEMTLSVCVLRDVKKHDLFRDMRCLDAQNVSMLDQTHGIGPLSQEQDRPSANSVLLSGPVVRVTRL